MEARTPADARPKKTRESYDGNRFHLTATTGHVREDAAMTIRVLVDGIEKRGVLPDSLAKRAWFLHLPSGVVLPFDRAGPANLSQAIVEAHFQGGSAWISTGSQPPTEGWPP